MKKTVKTFKQLYEILPKHTRVLDSKSHRMIHYTYDWEAAEAVKYEHTPPATLTAKMALYSVKATRWSFDKITGYDPKNMTEQKWVTRCLFLETVAGVPGMVAGMCRHLQSLRLMRRDNGWIHHLLEEADNERFHLLTFMSLKNPGRLMRLFILLIQGVFMNSFFVAYLIRPKFCHKFVGYLEEEAVKTYSVMLQAIDREDGELNHWNKIRAPAEAIQYYHLHKDATYRDLVLSIRADEACHRETNHFLAEVRKDYNLEEEKVIVYNEDSLAEEEKKQHPEKKDKFVE